MPEGPDTSYVDVKPPDPPTDPDAGAEPRPQSERPLRGDKQPRKRARKSASSSKPPPQGAVLKARSKTLEAKLGELLAFPAVPAAMFAPEPITQAYMLEHFTRSGPRTAAVLVEASESNPQLRALLERITMGGSMFTVALAMIAYAAPPAMWMLGMREQAARVTQATTLDPETLDRMMREANAAAQTAHESAQRAAAAAGAESDGAASAAPAPGADPLDAQP